VGFASRQEFTQKRWDFLPITALSFAASISGRMVSSSEAVTAQGEMNFG